MRSAAACKDTKLPMKAIVPESIVSVGFVSAIFRMIKINSPVAFGF